MLDLADWLSIYKAVDIALIPCQAGKKEPAIQWGKYEETPPTDEEIYKWFKESGVRKNFAVLCGKPSKNLIVLDFDYPEVFEKFFDKEKIKKTWVVKTPHGYHVYFRSCEPIDSFDIPKCVEVRSTGRYVIAPPSFFNNHSGKSLDYSFLSRPTEIQTATNLVEAVVKRAKELGYYSEKRFDEKKWLNLSFGYVGGTPPCIKKLVSEKATIGERDERALRIACYYANFCNDIDEARDKLIRWYDNSEQSGTDPFTLRDAIGKIDSARKGGYVYGCDDWLLSQYCSPCPLGESKYIDEILSSPDILEHIKTLLDDVIAGEDANKQLIFLLLLSGKVSNPERKQIVLLQGEAGGGKTTLASNISSIFNTKRVGRFTKHALDYSDLQGYDVLYLQEIGDMDREEQGISTLKFLSADDKGYTLECTVRDPETKEWITIERRIPPITVVTTTTRVDIDPQFARRAWPLNVDESVKQTEKIKDFKVSATIEKTLVSLGFKKERQRERALRILRKVVERLSNCDIAFLFPKSILNILGTPKRIRTRGDYDKFLELAWLTSFLHQNQAQLLPSNPGKTPIFLAPALQVAETFKITKDPLVAMTTDLEMRFIDLFDAIKEEGYDSNTTTFTKDERAKLATRLGKQPGTISNYFRELAKRCPYVLRTRSGREVHYSLDRTIDEIKAEILQNTAELESSEILALKFLEESKNQLDSICDVLPPGNMSDKFEQAVRESIEKEETKLKKLIKSSNSHELESSELVGFPEQKKTVEPLSSIGNFTELDKISTVVKVEQPEEGSCVVCGKTKILYWQLTDFEGNWGLACQDCGDSVMERLRRDGGN